MHPDGRLLQLHGGQDMLQHLLVGLGLLPGPGLPGVGVHEHLQVYMLDGTSTYYGIALQFHFPPVAVLEVPVDYGR